MNYLDSAITDVVVILDGKWTRRLSEASDLLKKTGMHIDHIDEDNGVVEGFIEASKTRALEKLECIDYVRKVFTYYRDHTPSDPRDRAHYQEI